MMKKVVSLTLVVLLTFGLTVSGAGATIIEVTPTANNVPITQVTINDNGSLVVQNAPASGAPNLRETPVTLISVVVNDDGQSVTLQDFNMSGGTVTLRGFADSGVTGAGNLGVGVVFDNGSTIKLATNKEAFRVAVEGTTQNANLNNYAFFDNINGAMPPAGTADFDVMYEDGITGGDYILIMERWGNTYFEMVALGANGTPISGANTLRFGYPTGAAYTRHDWNTGYANKHYQNAQAYALTVAKASKFFQGTSIPTEQRVIFGFRIDNNGEADIKLLHIQAPVPTYTVTFDPGLHGDFTAVSHIDLNYGATTPTAPATPGDAGWMFSGWSPALAATVTQNITYVAQWTPTFTVTYLPGTQGTFTEQSIPGLIGGAATPTPPTATGNAGYTFTGWIPTWSATVTGNATYTAQWSLIAPTTYTVVYAPGTQGTFAAQTNSGLSLGTTTPAAPAAIGNAGYSFVGWSPAPTATVTNNVTYTAQWSLIIEPTTYTVAYTPGTQGTFATQTNSGLNFGTTTPAAPAAIGNAGYSFVGWSPTPTATVISNVTYVAQWNLITPTTYTVTYAPGTQGTFVTQMDSGLTFGTTTPVAPTAIGNAGYSFVGWSPAPTATVISNVTYTAQWAVSTATLYNVAVNAEIGGSASGGGTFLDETNATIVAISEEGYVFVAWEENGVVVSELPIFSFAVDRDYALTAIFGLTLDDEPNIPGAPELPQTGDLPLSFFYGIGSIITLAGIAIGRRRRK